MLAEMIIQLTLLLIAVLGASVYTLIDEERKKGFVRGYDRFRFTLLGALGISLVIWFSLGDLGSWIAVVIAWTFFIFSYVR